MTFNRCRFASYHIEQPTEVGNESLPCLRGNPQTVKQSCKLLRSRPCLVQSLLTSSPVQQREILGRRHRQETLVAAASSRLMHTRPRFAAASLQLHRCQMPTTVARPVLRSGVLAAWSVPSQLRQRARSRLRKIPAIGLRGSNAGCVSLICIF